MVSSLPSPNPERRLAALARILKLLRDTEELERLVPALLDNLQEELHYSLLWFGLYDRVQHRIMSQAYKAPQSHRLLKSNIVLAPGDLMEQVVIQQRPLVINDLRVESRIGAWNELAEQLNIQGVLLFPVRRRDTCHGVLLMGANQWGQPVSTSDRTFISTICSALADVLHKQEQLLQNQRRKDPGAALGNLISQLKTIRSREEQLAAIAQSIMQFVEPDRVRIFWLDPLKFDFWERLLIQSRQTKTPKFFAPDKPGLTISASEIRGVYQVLNHQQILVVGESQGSSLANVPDRFMQLVNARSLIVAPIIEADTLLGFLCIEGKEPQVWSDTSRDYVSTVANLTGLMMPSLSVAEIRQQSAAELQLLTGVVHSIQNDTDWLKTLEKCSEDLCRVLSAEQFLVLLHDADRGGYTLAFRKAGTYRKGQSLTWQLLDEVDWQMLERSEGAIAINDLTNDLKLLAWRENFQALQLESLLACNVAPGKAPEGIVMVASQRPRHWTPTEGQLLQKIAQQIGLILHQWRLQRQTDQQENLYGSIQWGLRTLQQTFELDTLEEAACRHIFELLDASLVVLVNWQRGATTAQVSRVITRRKGFGANQETEILMGSDAIINWAQQTDGPLPLTWEDFPEESRQWLFGPPGSKFLVVALKTAAQHVPNGVWIVADRSDRKWTDHHFSLLSLLSNQLAWSRRHLSVVDLLIARQESLETLNWYKHKRLDEVHRQLEIDLQRLSDPITQGKGLTAQRQLQLVRQMGLLTSRLQQVLDTEAWQLQSHHQTTPLISLLNRLMDRVNPLIQERHLWAKVHNDSNVIIGGDLEKIEFVLYELMVAACARSPEQGRLDIWCRPLERNWLELSITDDGDVSDQLLKELKNGRPDDILVPSLLDTPPGLHFSICQSLMQQIKGDFSLQKLDDGRTMSRVVLAVAGKGKPMTLPKPEGMVSQPSVEDIGDSAES